MANKGHTVMQKLILYLPSDDLTQANWVFSSADGTAGKSVTGGALEQLRTAAVENEVIVIPPAQDVLLTAVTLPKLPRYRLLQALPYALEEQLLADVTALHFAVGDYQADGSLPVAVIAKHKMEKWLAALKEIDVYPSVMLVPVLSVPLFEASWNIFVIGDVAVARTDTFSGFACDIQNLASLIELELAERGQKPQAIYCQNYTPTRLDLKLANSNVIEKQFPAENALQDIALKLKAPFINLCQGAFQAKHKPSENKKYWRVAGYLLAAWLGILLFSNIVSYTILHHQYAGLQSQINAIYKHNFPNATAVVEPKRRLQEKLDALLNQGNKNHLLLWLSYLGKSLPAATGVRLQQLDYRNGVLALDLMAKNFDQIDNLAKGLIAQGVAVKQQNVAAAGEDVKGTLIMTESKS
jgi:general secretion pathway protein L